MSSVVLFERKPFFSPWNLGSVACLCVGSLWFWSYTLKWVESDAGLWLAMAGAIGTFFSLAIWSNWPEIAARVDMSDDEQRIRITHRGREFSAPLVDVEQSELFVVTLLLVPVAYSFCITMHRPSTVVRSVDGGGTTVVPWPWRKVSRSFRVHSWFVDGGGRRLLAAATAVMAAKRAALDAKAEAKAPTDSPDRNPDIAATSPT